MRAISELSATRVASRSLRVSMGQGDLGLLDCPWCGTVAAMFALPGYLAAQAAVARGPLLFSGALSEGQFYSPPESFAGEGWWVGELPSGRGFVRSRVGWVCSFYSFCVLPGERQHPLPHTLPSIPPHPDLYLTPLPPRLFPLPSVCFPQGLIMNPMKKVLGRKASRPRYLAAHPHPTFGVGTPEKGQRWLSQGGQGLPSRG